MQETIPACAVPAKYPNSHGKRLSRFVFTLNNWTLLEYDQICSTPNVKWLIVGKEVSDSGTPHLQGACVIGRQVAFSKIKMWSGFSRCHIESMRGKPENSLVYCSKQDLTPFQSGSLPTPGKRNDLHDLIGEITKGRTLRQIVLSEDVRHISTIVRNQRGLQFVASTLQSIRTDAPLVFWISGHTGIGKTRAAISFAESVAGPDGYWISNGSLRWFDGYEGQPIAILDDLRTKHAEFSFLLRLLDRYPLRVEFKGGMHSFIPNIIIVTAPYTPREMWSLRRDEDLRQLERRVTDEIYCGEDDDHDYIEQRLRIAYDTKYPNGLPTRVRVVRPESADGDDVSVSGPEPTTVLSDVLGGSNSISVPGETEDAPILISSNSTDEGKMTDAEKMCATTESYSGSVSSEDLGFPSPKRPRLTRQDAFFMNDK